MPLRCSKMTVEGGPKIISDEGVVNFANCALKMLREIPKIRQACEVSAYFLTEIAVILFGTDAVPFPHPCKTKHHEENIAAILNKLSREIDLQLDHISPMDVASGDRRAVSNMLELLTAFILHCVDEDLLDFDGVKISPHFSYQNSLNERDHSEFPNDYSSHTRLSMSPELPRSMGRPCLPPNTPGQTSLHPADLAPYLHKPTNALHHYTMANISAAQYGQDHTNGSSPTKAERPVISGMEDSSQDKQERPSSAATNHLTPMQRLHPYFSLPSDESPPATPKGADELVEIVKHQSPPTVPPSLHCSPVFNGTVQQQQHTAPISISVDPWANAVLPPTNSYFTDETSGFGTQAQKLTATSSSAQRPNAPQPCSTLSDCDTDLDDEEGLKQTAILQRSLRRKVSSSSSGRGHSPTQTLTAVGASVTSMPSSLSELRPIPPSNDDVAHRHVACQTIEYANSRSPRFRCKQFGPSQRTCLDHHDVHDSHTSVATTNSILAWSLDHRSRTKHDASVDQHVGSTSSVLSSSLCSRPSERRHLGPCPSASVLLARTEGFSQALKRRLDYLRMIFCRAHDEAEAVSQLVQVIGSQNSETLEFMNRCLRTGNGLDREHPRSNNPYSFKPLENMVQQILAGVETLLSRGTASPCRKGRADASYSQKHTVNSTATSTTRLRFPHRHSSTGQSSQIPADPKTALNQSGDSEFEELMKLKHSLMLDALTWLRSELQPKGRSASKSSVGTVSARENPFRLSRTPNLVYT